MKVSKYAIGLLMFISSAFGQAADLVSIKIIQDQKTASTQQPEDDKDPFLQNGSYNTPNDGYFHQVEIKPWSKWQALKASLYYGGYVPFEIVLDNSHENMLIGNAEMLVKYSGGMTCQYPIQATLYPEEDGKSFYLKHRNQTSICTSNCIKCMPENLTERINPSPYTLKEKRTGL